MTGKRIENIRKLLNKGEAIIITSDTNRFYFTGMRSSAGTVLITPDTATLLIDFRYFEKASKTVTAVSVVLAERLYEQLSDLLLKDGISTLFVETDTVSIDFLESLKKRLSSLEISTENRISNEIKRLRSIKSASELESIKKAQKLTDRTFKYILDRINVGKTETEIMLDMEFFMRSEGSEGVAFDFIVVSGINSSLPHGVPTDKKIENGDFITMDFGAVVNGYRSDMTRTVAVGGVSEKQKTVYETVLRAQQAALDSIKSGVKCCEVDKTARDLINSAGFEGCFGHGLGHSVGLDIHESPACNTRDETLLESGMIMTVEPGIYLENEFGVRIEDMVYVTDNGFINLTESPKNLIVL